MSGSAIGPMLGLLLAFGVAEPTPACAQVGSTASPTDGDVVIHRDEWGVPHIAGPTDAKVVFGAGYAQAEDNWPQVEENFVRATGRAAELFGEEGLLDDYLARGLEIVQRSRREYESAPAPGWLGSVFTFNARSIDHGKRRYGVHDNSFVKVVEFGPEVRARSVFVFGQSGDADSPHFFDQAELYSQKRFKPAWFGPDDAGRHAVRTYTLAYPRRTAEP